MHELEDLRAQGSIFTVPRCPLSLVSQFQEPTASSTMCTDTKTVQTLHCSLHNIKWKYSNCFREWSCPAGKSCKRKKKNKKEGENAKEKDEELEKRSIWGDNNMDVCDSLGSAYLATVTHYAWSPISNTLNRSFTHIQQALCSIEQMPLNEKLFLIAHHLYHN